MRYRYFICDVFTDSRFGGNPLAVLPEAGGLTDRQMQQIAREFNFSESTFVLPSDSHTRKVRIFTPTMEVPFAGHPNIGTAFTLANAGELGEFGDETTLSFEEAAGPVPISIKRVEGGRIRCELEAPRKISIGKLITVDSVAKALTLNVEDIVTKTHQPRIASVGLPFVFAEVTNHETLRRARVDMQGIDEVAAQDVMPDIHVYAHCGDEDDFDIRARMFAPMDGVFEDPATGSANCALAGLLSSYKTESNGEFHWRIAQGVEMGRPSVLDARSHKVDGQVVATWIAGTSVVVSEGFIEVD